MIAPSDEMIRAVIEAWMATGKMTTQDGGIDSYVCNRVRAEMRRVEATPVQAGGHP